MIGTIVRVRDNCDNSGHGLQIDRSAELTGPIAEAVIAFRISSRSPILTIRKTGRESQRFLRTILRTKFDASGPQVEALLVLRDRCQTALTRE